MKNISLLRGDEIVIQENLEASYPNCSDGPAVITSNGLIWNTQNNFLSSELPHYEDGPAVIYIKGVLQKEYPDGRFFLKGREYSNKEYKNLITKNEN